MTDEDLIRKALRGNQSAIGSLYDRYVAAIYRYCWYQIHDEALAQDLTQDVFVQMIHSLRSFSFTGSFKNWLYTIAKRVVFDYLEEKYKFPKTTLGEWIPDEKPDDWIDPDEEKQQRVKERLVTALLSVVKPEEKEIIKLVYLQNYTSREAGAVTGRTPESVRVIIHRALQKIRTIYGEKKSHTQ